LRQGEQGETENCNKKINLGGEKKRKNGHYFSKGKKGGPLWGGGFFVGSPCGTGKKKGTHGRGKGHLGESGFGEKSLAMGGGSSL